VWCGGVEPPTPGRISNDGLHSVIGRRRISRFLKDLARPHVVGQDIPASRRPAASARADPTSLRALEH
jgi:hypothetical protein